MFKNISKVPTEIPELSVCSQTILNVPIEHLKMFINFFKKFPWNVPKCLIQQIIEEHLNVPEHFQWNILNMFRNFLSVQVPETFLSVHKQFKCSNKQSEMFTNKSSHENF